ELQQAVGVDRDRVGVNEGRAAVVGDAGALIVDVGVVQDSLAGVQEVAYVVAGLQPDDIGGAHALVDALAHEFGQDAPVVWAGPGDVGEVEDGGFRQALSHVGGGQIEVVVLQHDVGSGAAAGCFDNGLGEGLVDADVAVVPGLVDRTADVRGTGGVPHEMLQEPEQRVGEGVIEALVDGARHLHEVDVDLRIRQLHGAAGQLRGAPVAFRHGGGD